MENALLRQDENDARSIGSHRDSHNDQNTTRCIHDVLAVLAQELKKTSSNNGHRAVVESSSPNSRTFSSFGDSHTPPRAENFGRKRRRIDNASPTHVEPQVYSDELHDLAAQLPPDQVMDAIVDAYFDRIHPWIPMLHRSLFLSRLNDPQQRLGLTVILHAMVTAALKFVDEGTRSMLRGQVDNIVKRSRNTVILMAFDSLSVENLQALTIITFDDVLSPRPSDMLASYDTNIRIDGKRPGVQGMVNRWVSYENRRIPATQCRDGRSRERACPKTVVVLDQNAQLDRKRRKKKSILGYLSP